MDVPEFAFIIPVAPKHFEYLARFLRSNPWKNTFVVFSSIDNYNNFECKDKCIPLFASCEEGSVVNYKKFEGLKQAVKAGGFKYFIVCDAEVEVVASNFNTSTIMTSLDRFFENKTIFAGDIANSKVGRQILPVVMAGSIYIFKNKDDQNKLMDLTNNFRLYTWWSDIPVYAAEHLAAFFDSIDESRLSHESFDHLVYQYYLLLYHDFKIIQIPELKWSLELFNGDFAELEKHGVHYNWVAKYSYQQNPEYFNEHGTYLLYHLDRLYDINLCH